jgi:hypothetical protein
VAAFAHASHCFACAQVSVVATTVTKTIAAAKRRNILSIVVSPKTPKSNFALILHKGLAKDVDGRDKAGHDAERK